jgi:chemotaxis response regulator CheB
VSAQDEPTSLIWDAPRAVLQAGLADETLPLWGVNGSLKAAEEG